MALYTWETGGNHCNPYRWISTTKSTMAPRTDAKFLQQLCDKIPSEQMQRDLPIFFREAPKDPWKTLGTWMNGGMEKNHDRWNMMCFFWWRIILIFSTFLRGALDELSSWNLDFYQAAGEISSLHGRLSAIAQLFRASTAGFGDVE